MTRPETPQERSARLRDATSGALVGAAAVLVAVSLGVRGFALAAAAILAGGAANAMLAARRPRGTWSGALGIFSLYVVATIILWLIARATGAS
jgi:hypothetical protein